MNKVRVNLRLKAATYKMLKELADESGIRDIRVYATRKLIIPYSRRIDSSREFAKSPIPNRLPVSSYKDQTIQEHLFLDKDEKEALDKLVYYNHFIGDKGSLKTSLFMACLIYHQYDKKFGSEAKKPIESSNRDLNLDFLNPDRMF